MPTHRSASTCSKLFEILFKKNIKLNVVFRATLALKEHQKLVGLNWFKFERRLECDVEGQAAVNPTGACSSGHASDSKNNPLQQLVHTSRKLLCKAIKILKSAFLLKKKKKRRKWDVSCFVTFCGRNDIKSPRWDLYSIPSDDRLPIIRCLNSRVTMQWVGLIRS